MEIRALGADDLDAIRDIRTRAFGRKPDGDWDHWAALTGTTLGNGRFLGGFDGPRLIATARIIDFGQWWHGRRVSMGGISTVTVAPEERGRGAGRKIMTAALERCAELGHAVSVLYPATTPIYRSLGWEHAGALELVTLPSEALRTVATAAIKVRRAAPDDAAEVRAVISGVHAATGDCGPVDWNEATWRVRLADPDAYYYLADDGFLCYRWADGNRSVKVDILVAGSEETQRGLWGIVGSGSSIARTIRASVAPHDPALWLLKERFADEVRRMRWMFRLVDARAAITARGFPAGVCAEIPLSVEDPQRPGNSGSWLLSVAGGTGVLAPAPADVRAIRLGANGLAALYAGIPSGTLRRVGLIAGQAPGLDAVFATTPYALDYF